MRLRVHRTDGKTGSYFQDDERRAHTLVSRLHPDRLFASGPIVIGVFNPFTVLNPDEVCWVEVDTELQVHQALPRGVAALEQLSDRDDYEAVLARQWPLWRKFASKAGDLVEALLEVSLRDGSSLYLRATGYADHAPLVQAMFGGKTVVATRGPHVTLYINPKCIVRARVYHSHETVEYPDGLWIAEAAEI
ncbi:MAG: hypothetical protein JNM79_02385 [Burkholderiales bacterium]|nr:hypothetical protein [Burkholderiales bacterium]